MTQFRRAYQVTIDDIRITELDVDFRVVKTLKSEPNTCDLTVYNLNPEHRRQIAATEYPMVEIEAGYEEALSSPSLIFRGPLREAFSYKERSDWITELHTGDGESAFRSARINKSYGRGTKLTTVIGDVASSLGVGLGNTVQQALTATLEGAAAEFVNGVAISGKSARVMERIMRSVRKKWSIQDGELQLIDVNMFLEGLAVRLSPDTGLIGSPTIANDGTLKCTALMNGAITPGRSIVVSSREVSEAFYRAERCEYIGETAGNDWYVNIEAKAL